MRYIASSRSRRFVAILFVQLLLVILGSDLHDKHKAVQFINGGLNGERKLLQRLLKAMQRGDSDRTANVIHQIPQPANSGLLVAQHIGPAKSTPCQHPSCVDAPARPGITSLDTKLYSKFAFNTSRSCVLTRLSFLLSWSKLNLISLT